MTRFGNVWRVPDTSVITCSCSPKCECNEQYVVYKYHMGVQCSDYGQFFSSIKRKPLSNYLMLMEDDTHGDYNPFIHSFNHPYMLILLIIYSLVRTITHSFIRSHTHFLPLSSLSPSLFRYFPLHLRWGRW